MVELLKSKTTFVVVVLSVLFVYAETYRPLVVWHGFNDSCEGSLKGIIDHVKQALPGIEVFCIKIGDSQSAEKRLSMFMPLKKQLDLACAQVAAIPQLRNGFNALGESQGGILMRALVQKCPPGPVHNLITVSSPHQGVYGIPTCYERVPKLVCNVITYLFTTEVYTKLVQKILTAAQYWHNPYNEQAYVNGSEFLAEFNNERNFNENFKQNLMKVNKFVLIRNTEDDFIYPGYSSHFGYFKPGNVKEQMNFTSTRVFKEDLLGLKKMYESGQLVFESVPGKHCRLDWSWFTQEITKKYLQ